MKIEGHLEILKEVFLSIDICIEKGFQDFQSTIGFQTSLGAVEMLELYLHKKDLLSLSARITHEWMKSEKRINEKINFDFPRKGEIVQLIYYIEKKRNELCYGKRVAPHIIAEQLENFNRLRQIFREVGLDEV